MFVDTDANGSFDAFSMTPVGANQYLAEFPPSDCGSLVRWYVSANSSGGVASSPVQAPASAYEALSAASTDLTFSDNFESNLGWSVSGNAVDGQWSRGVPANGNRGDPATDGDGSGQCFVTDNVAGNSDVDTGTTTLTSPVMDATGGEEAFLSYWRWYSNHFGVHLVSTVCYR